jgi:hypothetical protein
MICLYLSADVSLCYFRQLNQVCPLENLRHVKRVRRRTDCGNTCHLTPKLSVYLSEHLVEETPHLSETHVHKSYAMDLEILLWYADGYLNCPVQCNLVVDSKLLVHVSRIIWV